MVRLLSDSFRSVKPHRPKIDLKLSTSSSQLSVKSPVKSDPSWSVYLILSTNTNIPIKTYVGVTTNFSRRLKQHNGELKGGAKSSRSGRPWVCACLINGFEDKSKACEFESRWKIFSRKLPRRKVNSEMAEQIENHQSLQLLQHRFAALDKVKGYINCSHLEIIWELDPF